MATFRVYSDGAAAVETGGDGPAVSAAWDAGVFEHYQQMRRCACVTEQGRQGLWIV